MRLDTQDIHYPQVMLHVRNSTLSKSSLLSLPAILLLLHTDEPISWNLWETVSMVCNTDPIWKPSKTKDLLHWGAKTVFDCSDTNSCQFPVTLPESHPSSRVVLHPAFLPSNLKPDPSPTIRRPGKRHKLTTHMEASINGATSTFQIIQILVGCSLANHLFWGTPTASWKPPHPQSGEISASSAPTSRHGCQVCPSPSQKPPWPPPPSASLRTRWSF